MTTKNEAKHTPGPLCCADSESDCREQKLYAAAPDLLAALRLAINCVTEDNKVLASDAAMSRARAVAAILKAERGR